MSQYSTSSNHSLVLVRWPSINHVIGLCSVGYVDNFVLENPFKQSSVSLYNEHPITWNKRKYKILDILLGAFDEDDVGMKILPLLPCIRVTQIIPDPQSINVFASEKVIKYIKSFMI